MYPALLNSGLLGIFCYVGWSVGPLVVMYPVLFIYIFDIKVTFFLLKSRLFDPNLFFSISFLIRDRLFASSEFILGND